MQLLKSLIALFVLTAEAFTPGLPRAFRQSRLNTVLMSENSIYPTLSVDNQLTTVIALFEVGSERAQNELIDSMSSFRSALKDQPGFVSSSIHRSTDGVKVAAYSQWRSLSEYTAFSEKNRKEDVHRSVPCDLHVYEIVASESKMGPVKISTDGPPLVHFTEFSMKPENQPRMVQLAKEHVGPAMEQEGLLSATFHRSLDGTRVINYGQWENAEAIEALRTKPGFGKDKPYWEGLAENEFHLYTVVSSICVQ